jgi:hypothetical protein
MAPGEDAEHIGQVRDVAAIAMGVQQDRAWIGTGHVPAVQPRAVGRLEPGVFVGELGRVPIAARIAERLVDLRDLERSQRRGQTDRGAAERKNQQKQRARRPAAAGTS